MKEILNFLRTIYNNFANIIKLKDSCEEKYIIKLVIGNTSCDMDSFLSSIVLSYIRNVQSKFIHVTKNEEITYCIDTNKGAVNIIHIPVINCPKGELPWRLDIAELINRLEIDHTNFFYFEDSIIIENDKLIFGPLSKQPSISFEIILVDHHDLPLNQQFISKYVTEIIDHHNDEGFNYKSNYPRLLKHKCEFPLASCMTLILEEFFTSKSLSDYFDSFYKDNFFDMLVAPQLIDSVNFSDKVKNSKWIEKDKKYVVQVIDSIKKSVFSNIIEEIQYMNNLDFEHINRLYAILNDCKFSPEKNIALGIEALINKDRKDLTVKIKDTKLKICFASFPVNFNILIEKYGIDEFNKIAEAIAEKSSIDLFIILFRKGDKTDEIQALHFISKGGFLHHSEIFNENTLNKYRNELYSAFTSRQELKVTKFEIMFKVNNKENIFLLESNGTMSRKIILPEIQKFFESI